MPANPHAAPPRNKCLALAGGVGGAKLALGLSKILHPDELTVIVNTGDDDLFHGLHVSPDLDTVMYTLAAIANPETGWGIAGETFRALDALRTYAAPDAWFNLGDRDLATHIRRADLLQQGKTLSQATASLCAALGVKHPIAPMSDQPVRTILHTDEGALPMQRYFVKRRCEPIVSAIEYRGAADARPSPAFTAALARANIIVFCPSNPFLSVAPMLAVPGVRSAIANFNGPRVAVSPIIGGKAVKGPAAKLLRELGHDATSVGVARQYADICDIFIIDNADAALTPEIEALGMTAVVTDAMMLNDADKIRLAQFALNTARQTAPKTAPKTAP